MACDKVTRAIDGIDKPDGSFVKFFKECRRRRASLFADHARPRIKAEESLGNQVFGLPVSDRHEISRSLFADVLFVELAKAGKNSFFRRFAENRANAAQQIGFHRTFLSACNDERQNIGQARYFSFSNTSNEVFEFVAARLHLYNPFST